jgi:hypothetical protein
MENARTRALATVGVLLSTAALTASLIPGALAGTTKTWHILPVDKVEQARLTEVVIKNIDASITAVEYRQGGVGNTEICGFDRTEQISASRQARWTTSGTRRGTTLIMQFHNLVDGGAAFSRLKQTYQACTAQDFPRPERTTVKYRFLTKKKQIQMVWALFTTDAKTEIQRAEGLSIRRAGGALIVTRTIATDVAGTRALKMKKSVALTSRQFGKYKSAAYF